VIAFLTAGAVFGVGQMLLPQPDWARPVTPPPPTISPVPTATATATATLPAPPAPAPVPAAAQAAQPTAAATPPASAPSALPHAETPPTPAQTESASAAKTPADSARRAAERPKMTDREIARAAWRKNLPDVAADAGHASILIPIRGSTAGSSFKMLDNPKGVLITLPKAESMISMEFYKIRRDGFLNLWIKHGEAEGTTLRLMLGDATNPDVEIQDDFVRVNVQKIAPAPGN
jgi:hypothetical protein